MPTPSTRRLAIRVKAGQGKAHLLQTSMEMNLLPTSMEALLLAEDGADVTSAGARVAPHATHCGAGGGTAGLAAGMQGQAHT